MTRRARQPDGDRRDRGFFAHGDDHRLFRGPGQRWAGSRATPVRRRVEEIDARAGTRIVISASGRRPAAASSTTLVAISRTDDDGALRRLPAPGTRGRTLADGAKEVKLLGQYVTVARARRPARRAVGARDAGELIEWLRAADLSPRRVFVTTASRAPPMRCGVACARDSGGTRSCPSSARRSSSREARDDRVDCRAAHTPQRIVLTGGPGRARPRCSSSSASRCAPRRRCCRSPPGSCRGWFRAAGCRRSARRQRAIFHVQRELEAATIAGTSAIALCDRATVDGMAYGPGPTSCGPPSAPASTAELARYHAVIHLRTRRSTAATTTTTAPDRDAAEAAAIDERIAEAWARHPRRYEVASAADFLTKAARAVELLRAELPACCTR